MAKAPDVAALLLHTAWPRYLRRLAAIGCLVGLSLLSTQISADAIAEAYRDIREQLNGCALCHGQRGASLLAQYPILAGQRQYYLYVQLKDYKSGLRADPVMGPLAAALSKDEMLTIAKYYSQQQWPTPKNCDAAPTRIADATLVEAGQCKSCHLGSLQGNSRVPRLRGQHPDYLLKTMLDFRTRARANAPDKPPLMRAFEPAQLEALARLAANLCE